jgi:hypothetical protein
MNGVYYITMNTSNTTSQVEINKAISQRYFEAYNNKNEAIFDEIIFPDFSTMVSLFIWAPLEWELLEQKMTLRIL